MTDTNPPDDGFYAEIAKRTPMLEAIREGPRSLQELDQMLSMSRSTIHRTIRSFEELGLLRKEGNRYALTGHGLIVADEATTFRDRLQTAYRLGDFFTIIHPTDVQVPFELFADAKVTQPQPQQAHTGVKRIIDFIEQADSLRMFSNIISPLYVDVALREMRNGMDIEVIFDDSVLDIVQTEYAEQAIEAYDTGRFTVLVEQDVPFELFLAEDRMAMAAHDDSALPHVVIETDSPSAREWAEDVYMDYREAAANAGPERATTEADGEVDWAG